MHHGARIRLSQKPSRPPITHFIDNRSIHLRLEPPIDKGSRGANQLTISRSCAGRCSPRKRISGPALKAFLVRQYRIARILMVHGDYLRLLNAPTRERISIFTKQRKLDFTFCDWTSGLPNSSNRSPKLCPDIDDRCFGRIQHKAFRSFIDSCFRDTRQNFAALADSICSSAGPCNTIEAPLMNWICSVPFFNFKVPGRIRYLLEAFRR